jgi:uncharacterized protein (TIGR03437 family)
MNRQRKIFIAKTVAVLSVIPVLIYAHASGPDPGKSGVLGESTCNESGCHTGTPLNQGGGSMTIDAGGTTYTRGVAQQISVTISDPKQRRWGFQLTARTAASSTTEAGTFTPLDGTTQVFCSSVAQLKTDPSNVLRCGATAPLEYVEHTLAGARTTAIGAGNTFKFNWTPPATDVGPIILYAAGNAANGDSDVTGDHIYTTTLTLTASGSGAGGPSITEVDNGATYQPGFSSNTISPNAYVAIKGSGLATNTRLWGASDFNGNNLPTNLDGTTVTINGKPAFVYYISPTQVNVLAPVDSSAGPVDVQLTFNGAASKAMSAPMQQIAPAFFLFDGKYIAARHADFSLMGPTTLYPGLTTPAKPGETVLLYGHGFGPTNPPAQNGQILSGAPVVTGNVIITIGGVDVTPDFAGLVAAGEYQINVKVPDSVHGDVPVVARVDGVSLPSNAFINVQ